jgi:exosortase
MKNSAEPIKQTTEPSSGGAAETCGRHAVIKWGLVLLPLGYLWFHLIDDLRLEWDTNPQYSYGLVVPILVVGLLFRRWLNPARRATGPALNHPKLLAGFFGLLALLVFPTRLIEAATPEWRPLQWTLALEVIGLTLYAIYLAGGKNWLRQAAFPILFFLVAVPWPSPIETPLIQGLSRMNASLVVEVMGILGVPSMAHGNVIQVSTGVVGINDACSGIRSFQSSLMISLFLGEFYLFNWRRRLLLIPLGFIIALSLNLCRASLLTWIAATKGIEAIGEYHDEAGFTILLICTALLWGMAWLVSLRRASASSQLAPQMPMPAEKVDPAVRFRSLDRFAAMLLVWLVLVETGVQTWYHFRESKLKPGRQWTVVMPTSNPTYQDLPVTPDEITLLRFDEAKQGEWREADGTDWTAYYFDWRPGRVAGYLAKRHTPDICLTATGLKMTAGPKLEIMRVHDVDLPMRCYTFSCPAGPLQVFQCHWESGLPVADYTADESGRFNLIRGVWAGRGNRGQKVLEVVISGSPDAETAQKALRQQLEKLVKVAN